MDPCWRIHLHDPVPPTPLPQYLQSTVNATITAITPSLLAEAPPSSVLLIGPHASGKSLVTKHVLHHLRTTASKNAKSLEQVTLTGLLHSTPIRAWRHIATTLSPDNHSYSTSTVQECLAAISNIFATFRNDRTPLIIVLDHFDRFITTTDGMSQTVLYSLLNFLQDPQIRIACIAMTSSIDVTDALEKRVKSRFLHRQLVVPLPQQPDDIQTWLLQVLLTKKKANKSSVVQAKLVHQFLAHPRCFNAIRKSMLRTRTVPPILHAVDAALVKTLHQVDKKNLNTRVKQACDIFENILITRDPIADILQNLTELEIALLMALRKLTARTDTHDEKITITFTHVFKHYESAVVEDGFATTQNTDRLVERAVAEKSWERLVECGAVVRLGHGPREMRSCVLGVAGEDVDHALQHHPVASSLWQKWGKKR